MTYSVYLGLGSNLGQRTQQLRQALSRLERQTVRLEAVSSLYESAPVGPVTQQPPFLNAVAQCVTEIPPRSLLAVCQAVETQLGRQRARIKGPRSIDLDLLWVHGVQASWPELVLPHPEITRRRFVLEPLLEIEPSLRHPLHSVPLAAFLPELQKNQHIEKIKKTWF